MTERIIPTDPVAQNRLAAETAMQTRDIWRRTLPATKDCVVTALSHAFAAQSPAALKVYINTTLDGYTALADGDITHPNAHFIMSRVPLSWIPRVDSQPRRIEEVTEGRKLVSLLAPDRGAPTVAIGAITENVVTTMKRALDFAGTQLITAEQLAQLDFVARGLTGSTRTLEEKLGVIKALCELGAVALKREKPLFIRVPRQGSTLDVYTADIDAVLEGIS